MRRLNKIHYGMLIAVLAGTAIGIGIWEIIRQKEKKKSKEKLDLAWTDGWKSGFEDGMNESVSYFTETFNDDLEELIKEDGLEGVNENSYRIIFGKGFSEGYEYAQSEM